MGFAARTAVFFAVLLNCSLSSGEETKRVVFYSSEVAEALRIIESAETVIYEVCPATPDKLDQIEAKGCKALMRVGLPKLDMLEFSGFLKASLQQELNSVHGSQRVQKVLTGVMGLFTLAGIGVTTVAFVPRLARAAGAPAGPYKVAALVLAGMGAVGAWQTLNEAQSLGEKANSLEDVIQFYGEGNLSEAETRELAPAAWEYFIRTLQDSLRTYIMKKYFA
ncbi:MAG: hypothetical protein AB7G93_10525 [Bdellovibrionales bacterium]